MNTLNIIISLFNFALLLFFLILWLGKWTKVETSRKKIKRKTNRILEKALDRHDEIISDATQISKNLQVKADKSFNITVEKINKQNEAFYKKATGEFENAVASYVKSLEVKGDAELKTYSDKIYQEIVDKSSTLQDQIDQVTKSFSKELEEFKQSEKQRIQTQLTSRIDEIVKSLIPANISIEDHDKLVESTMEKADKEGLFR